MLLYIYIHCQKHCDNLQGVSKNSRELWSLHAAGCTV
jgi:hypothetical protein